MGLGATLILSYIWLNLSNKKSHEFPLMVLTNWNYVRVPIQNMSPRSQSQTDNSNCCEFQIFNSLISISRNQEMGRLKVKLANGSLYIQYFKDQSVIRLVSVFLMCDWKNVSLNRNKWTEWQKRHFYDKWVKG